MTAFDKAFSEVVNLVDSFKANERHYLAAEYQEAEVRKDYIDKFFKTLGWDVDHDEQKNPYEQEVKVERGQLQGAAHKRADYAFSMAPNFRDVRFFVEAKKPHGDIEIADNYFQTIRYGWNSQNLVAVLTDFQCFHILDCRYKPSIDTALQRGWRKFHYSQYKDAEIFAQIYWLFSHEAVLAGSLDPEKLVPLLPKARGKAIQRGLFKGGYQSIDEEFLTELDEHRDTLARGFKNRNPELDSETLTEITQRTIDRLVFLRFLEDRLIEDRYHVANYGAKGSAWGDFIADCRRLDKIYNGVVFKQHNILDAPEFKVDDNAFSGICEQLAHINSPYDFNVIPIHILGSIYERFLGKVIVATDKRARVEEKPEVRKAGGVYYTPEYIVRYIVANTVGKLIEGKSPAQVAKMHFADISCGSGSFLLGVYDLLLRWHTTYYNTHPTTAKKGDLVQKDDGLHLSLRKRRELLLNNVYGVDIDAQAVEVAQLSLYLKLLQEESAGTRQDYQIEFHETLLPPLNKNIVCGNSLIGTDVSDGQLFSTEEERKINPMDFEQRFPEIMKGGGFDAILGNPPYIRIQTLQETDPKSAEYLSNHYVTAAKGNYDIYVVFVERAVTLLNQKGRHGFIIPHKFFNAHYGEALRTYLTKNKYVCGITHFGHQQVFDGATTYTCLLFTQKAPARRLQIAKVDNLKEWESAKVESINIIPGETLSAGEWVFVTGEASALLDKLRQQPVTLQMVTHRIFQGLKTSADKIYIVEERQRKGNDVLVWSPEKEAEYWLEADLLHPLIKGGDSKRYRMAKTDRLIIFPYEKHEDNSVRLISQTAMKAQYPKIWDYLLANKTYLDNRESGRFSGPNWYQFGRSQALDVMPLPKLFTPDLAACASFSIDETGECFFTGGVAGGYGLLPKPGISFEFLLGLLNSRLLNWVVAQTGTVMRGGYFSFEARFIRSLPIWQPITQTPSHLGKYDKMVALVGQMMSAKKQLSVAQNDKDKDFYENKCAALDRQIDTLVYELYGLTENEINIVEAL